jgi:hypothetical protein
MKFTPPLKCKYDECNELIESGRADIEYCSQYCQQKDRYRQNAEKEKRLNAIKAQIRKADKLLQRMYRIWGSKPIPATYLLKEGFVDGGYHELIEDKATGRWVRHFDEYAFYFDTANQTINIFKANDLRTE